MPILVNARLLPILASLALLGGAAVEELSLRPPPDAAPYHLRVHDAADRLHLDIDGWTAQDVAEPIDVVQLLQPNVLITRKYSQGEEHFWVIIVQCTDSRTLQWHYPPVCYVDMGYTQTSSVPIDWPVGDWTVTGTEYEFSRDALDSSTAILVDNFMILPDGRFSRDMAPVAADASNQRKRGFGAAEVQVLFGPGFNPTHRRAITGAVLEAAAPVISVIRSGPKE